VNLLATRQNKNKKTKVFACTWTRIGVALLGRNKRSDGCGEGRQLEAAVCDISLAVRCQVRTREREASEQEEPGRWRKGEGGSKDSERLDGVEWGLVLRVVVGVGGLVEDVENLVLLFLA